MATPILNFCAYVCARLTFVASSVARPAAMSQLGRVAVPAGLLAVSDTGLPRAAPPALPQPVSTSKSNAAAQLKSRITGANCGILWARAERCGEHLKPIFLAGAEQCAQPMRPIW
jgi:hypothetical protein